MASRLPFPEAVANEKRYWEPLHNAESVSAQLRRRLFKGEELYAEDGVAAGATNGVVGAMTRLMEEWGFEFETVHNAEGKKGVKLKNREHVPVEHLKKPSTGQRRRRNGDDEEEGGRKKGPSPVHQEIRDKLISGAELSAYESMQMGASDAFLRKEVKRLEAEGYKFAITGHGPERSYKLSRAPKGARRPSSPSSITKSPIHEVPLSPTTAADMMFGELATPAPKLGGHLRVMGLMLNEDDDGEEIVSVVMKNGSGMWKARIEGYVDQEQDA